LAKGVPVEAYGEELIQQKVIRPHDASRIGLEELDRFLDSLSEGSEDSSAPPPEDYTRERFYREHN
jgi:hypothetical protein